VAGADGVVIATHHTSYDWNWLQQHARLIVDTRHVLPQARVAVPALAWG
jgi:UDP-N-acetyl-D-mannosaminuronate dehydrogenase